MDISVNWLKEWVNFKTPVNHLINDLTMGGIEVDGCRLLQPLNNVVVGRIICSDQHPNADSLRVCQVDVGENKPLSIVCGAPNAQDNLSVVVAKVSAVLPNGLTITERKIRSVLSQGMLCSAAEIGFSDEHSGIMELRDDAPIGHAINDYLNLNDSVLSLDITPNRGDCFSALGIARELSAYYQLDICYPEQSDIKTTINDTLPSDVRSPDACPRYLTRIIKNIDNTVKTPQWLANKLIKAGQGLNSAIVDIGNYVMLELGQPLHAFDLNEISNQLIVRQSQSEQVRLLNNKEVQLDNNTLVIADDNKVLAIAGVMGSLAGSVSTDTRDIILEAAFFTPHLLSGCARKYGLHTDASLRFERGVDFNLAQTAINRITALILEITGGEAAPINHTENTTHLPVVKPILLKQTDISQKLGIELEGKWIVQQLQQLGFGIESHTEQSWQVSVPSYRFDITLPEDLSEELARLYGYDKLPVAELNSTHNHCNNPTNNLSKLYPILVNEGYQELINYSFIDQEIASKINALDTLVTLKNPISKDMSVMRQSLWQGLLLAVKKNAAHSHYDCRFFEVGLCFYGFDLSQQIKKIAGVISGQKHKPNWRSQPRQVDFYDCKATVEKLLSSSKKPYYFKTAAHPLLQTGQSAEVLLADKSIGYIGKLSARVAKMLDINPCYLFELNFEPLVNKITPIYKVFSNHQLSLRDLAVVVDENISAQTVLDCITELKQPLLIDVGLFDVYQGEGITKGKKSLAFTLSYQAQDKTLVDEEIEQQVEAVFNILHTKFSALRR